jgi:hypothetical protein
VRLIGNKYECLVLFSHLYLYMKSYFLGIAWAVQPKQSSEAVEDLFAAFQSSNGLMLGDQCYQGLDAWLSITGQLFG